MIMTEISHIADDIGTRHWPQRDSRYFLKKDNVCGKVVSMRIGMGYDVHRLVEGRDLIIGGVKIPYEKGLLGHSDADVLLHAIMDALLGAAALGDIGKHFPDTDPAYKGISSIKLLEDITGQKVEAFRAPGFSIRESEGWAFEILHELGIRMDSSVFPAHHAHGGMPSYVSAVPSWVEYNGIRMKEFPIVYRKILGKHIVFSGGGYFRLVPYRLLRKWTRECPEYLLAYIHPRDLDAEQPMIEDLNYIRRFKSYYGLRGAEEKLKRWLG